MYLRYACTLLVFSLFFFQGVAQQTLATLAPYQKNPKVPEFGILSKDSATWITDQTLKQGKPVMIVLFSPDCDHCVKFAEEMRKDYSRFTGIEIVMTTYQPITKMNEFSKKLGLDTYRNIYFGRDVKYFFGPFYKLKSTPFVALYDSSHKLITAYDGGAPTAKIINDFKGK